MPRAAKKPAAKKSAKKPAAKKPVTKKATATKPTKKPAAKDLAVKKPAAEVPEKPVEEPTVKELSVEKPPEKKDIAEPSFQNLAVEKPTTLNSEDYCRWNGHYWRFGHLFYNSDYNPAYFPAHMVTSEISLDMLIGWMAGLDYATELARCDYCRKNLKWKEPSSDDVSDDPSDDATDATSEDSDDSSNRAYYIGDKVWKPDFGKLDYSGHEFPSRFMTEVSIETIVVWMRTIDDQLKLEELRLEDEGISDSEKPYDCKNYFYEDEC